MAAVPDAELPAPQGRASDETLEQMVSSATGSPLFRALLDWIDGAVVVLNRQRQIVMASPELALMLGLDAPDAVIGRRLGEVLGCSHATDGPDGCGTSRACRYCGALRAILHSQRDTEPVESECRVTLGDAGNTETLSFRVRASRTVESDWDFSVVALQLADSVPRGSVEKAGTIVSGKRDWPGDGLPYAWVRRLGVGGMGSVFLVRNHNGREFALKTLKAEHLESSTYRQRFFREMTLARQLEHPCIVRTLRAATTDDDIMYMVSEFCPGGSAHAYLKSHGPIDVELGLMWMHRTLSALDYAWREHRLVHRDVKPDNLLLDEDGMVKLTDFGIARRLETTELRLTSPNSMLGTVHYMAPEQTMDTCLDTRADLYALGATFYELLTGRPPFDGPNPAAILSKKLVDEIPPMARFSTRVPASVERLLFRLLDRDPDQRPNEPAEVLKALDTIAAELSLDFSVPTSS